MVRSGSKAYVYVGSEEVFVCRSLTELYEKFGLKRECLSMVQARKIGFIFFIHKGKLSFASRNEISKEDLEEAFKSIKYFSPSETKEYGVQKQKEMIKNKQFQIDTVQKTEKPKPVEENRTNVQVEASMDQLKKIAEDFHNINELNGFNAKTFENCGTLVKNMDSNTRVYAPLLGNLVVNGVKITIVGKFIKNENGNDQVALKGFAFGEKEVKKVDVSQESSLIKDDNDFFGVW